MDRWLVIGIREIGLDCARHKSSSTWDRFVLSIDCYNGIPYWPVRDISQVVLLFRGVCKKRL